MRRTPILAFPRKGGRNSPLPLRKGEIREGVKRVAGLAVFPPYPVSRTFSIADLKML
jgi:hypothetical protein